MKIVLALIVVIPFLGFIINGVFGRWITRDRSGLIACSTVLLSMLLGLMSVLFLAQEPIDQRLFETRFFVWIETGPLQVDIGFQYDPLSAIMVLIVTGVGFLIHVYSIGYMEHEQSYARYFAYMNLFTCAMLVLVLADSFLLMFVGWEGVGLCSYLLIGFWYTKKSAADAGKKAFIVNRIGDCGFIVGIIVICAIFDSLDFTEVFTTLSAHELLLHKEFPLGISLITLISLALFVGAIGKSAQIPLYVWLPDAMEGPTPVSALIHAATMVTAGVYMVARCHALFLMSGTALQIVALVGGITAFWAATIAVMQHDIKRILAYSTISQLGYMFLGCGAAAFSAGIFHLMTHAFFKALLFLGAGSVIHALSAEQDIRKMGGLRHKLPTTYWVFLVATLAITGVPGFSGFFSKEAILWSVYTGVPDQGLSGLLWLIGLISAGMTALYMFRLFFITFSGKTRIEAECYHQLHESPNIMLIPLIILAFFAFSGGYLGLPELLGGHNIFQNFLEPVFAESAWSMGPVSVINHSHVIESLFMLITVLVTAGGIVLAAVMYHWKTDIPGKLADIFPGIYGLVRNKYYIDELYERIIILPVRRISERFLWKLCDITLIDGLVNGCARVIYSTGAIVRLITNGSIHRYVSALVVGFIGFLIYIVILLH
ncbi:NADH-quinone oxidoreductase subunit L [bacterium]|nr:NADH-quinone oxidoreductase subunit L [bacterium]